MYCSWVSKVTVANPVLPSALIWTEPPGPYGLVMLETCGTAFTSASIWLTEASTEGSVTGTPLVVWKTICSRSPATFGAAAWSKDRALVDSVLGSEKLFE